MKLPAQEYILHKKTQMEIFFDRYLPVFGLSTKLEPIFIPNKKKQKEDKPAVVGPS